VGRERGDLVGVDSLKATEAVNQRRIDGSVYKDDMSRQAATSVATLSAV
jgi:hypothetical protein